MDKNKAIPLTDIGLDEHRELMRETKGIIYKITNIINGKVYIGQTTLSFYRRYRDGFTRCNNPHLKRSIDKYGLSKFVVNILYSGLSIAALNIYEETMISMYDSCNPEKGYNLRTGGENSKHTPRALKRISEATKGKNKGKDNKNSKRSILIYKGETIIRDCRQDLVDYMQSKYNINVRVWFDKGITYKYQKDVESCGYLNEDGTVEECKRNKSMSEVLSLSRKVCSKKTVITYKGNIHTFNSLEELIVYMKKTYGVSCANWFGSKGAIPYIHQKNVLSCGYLNEDGTVEECKRGIKKKGESQSKKVKMVLNDGTEVITNSYTEMSDYLYTVYGIKGVDGWNAYDIPLKYQELIISFGYLREDGTVEEFKRAVKKKRKKMGKQKVVIVYKGEEVIRDSIKEISTYFSSMYDIKVSKWFYRGITQKYKKDVSFCGDYEDYLKYKEEQNSH